MNYEKEFADCLQKILKTFGGADGGISFVNFRFICEKLAKEAENGDYNAQQILDVVFKFSKLIVYCQNLK